MITQIRNRRVGQFLAGSNTGQVALETAAALIAIFIFTLGLIQILVWFVRIFVDQAVYYQGSRTTAGTRATAGAYSFTPRQLNIFGTGSGATP